MAQLQPYCAIEGNDDGLPVVFVHGMGVDHRSLMMLDKAFDGNDSIRRIYLDLPGFGRTPALPEHACGLPEMADWLQTAIDGLVGKAAPFAMVGNSMGGALVREVLAREPRRVAGMALIAPVVDPQHAGRHVAEHVVAQPNPKLTHSLPQEQVFDFITMGVNQSFDAWRRYQRFILPGVALCDRSGAHRHRQARPDRRIRRSASPVAALSQRHLRDAGQCRSQRAHRPTRSRHHARARMGGSYGVRSVELTVC